MVGVGVTDYLRFKEEIVFTVLGQSESPVHRNLQLLPLTELERDGVIKVRKVRHRRLDLQTSRTRLREGDANDVLGIDVSLDIRF